ncbi:Phospholipid-transporting ATPase [Pleurostoma richardsiae]|uniref:Phospholipid-transporting ATPase n=1 Tax=Pleurostoma richardsiae TaxID=41990 RepID=A0AA38VHW5_9PEZI|nr:Phospholipid-transporting ATPase [Pleurostoma richardsiae]
MAGRRSEDATSVLRERLEHLEEAETLVPHGRPSLQSERSPEEHHFVRRAATDEFGEASTSPRPAVPPLRRAITERRSAADPLSPATHVRFSADLLRDVDEDHTSPPPLRVNTDLYTIESRTEGPSQPLQRPRERQASKWMEGSQHEEASSSRAEDVAERRRFSGASVTQTPVSLTRPRHLQLGLGGLDESVKNVATAAEASVTLAHYKDWAARQRERRRRWTRGPVGRVKAKAAALYQAWILEGLLRQKPLPPSVDGRHIPLMPGFVRRKPLIDDRRGAPYISNFIRSSRYTLWNFLPKQLFFQFSKLANFYFLTIGILQMIPGLSTTGTYTTIAPLMAFVALSMGKEGYDDYRRYKLDKVENRSDAWVLDPEKVVEGRRRRLRDRLRRRRENVGGEMGMEELEGMEEYEEEEGAWSTDADSWSRTQWQDLRVGDIIRLRRDENVPADIALLHATGPNGIAYIETMALDGETNLKSKQACPLLAEHCRSLATMQACNAEIVSEDPNLDLYNYDGRVTVNGETMPLTLNEVVYRGSTLRNTSQAIGLVVNTGEECKIRMNAHKNVHAKAPAMQKIVNRIVILLVIFVAMLSLGCTVGYLIWKGDTEDDAWYLSDISVPFAQILVGFIIAFNTLIPLSLYVSLEIIKIGQFILLKDVDMYDPVTDTPMVANTTTILENLGQVSYVFSDKTGTLTENLMRFRKMSVAGTAWLHDADLRKEAEKKQRDGNGTVAKSSKGNSHASHPSDQIARLNSATPILRKQAEATEVPLMDAPLAPGSLPRRSGSLWRSSVRPTLSQPEMNTDDLVQYIRRKPRSPFSRKARQFILCIALCHTCLPETKEDGEIDFQAASPDELALVEAARDLGFLLIDRPAQSIKLRFPDVDGSGEVEETYEVLDVIEFSSKRKRMSIIIRMPDGRICMFSKGADSVILPRLKQNHLAMKTASAVERRASVRKSMEQEKALMRRSMQGTPRNSMNLIRAASTLTQRRSLAGRGSAARSTSLNRRSGMAVDEVDFWLRNRETQETDTMAGNDDAYQTPRPSMARQRSTDLITSPIYDDMYYEGMVDEQLAVNDAAIFERCFQHIDDFASEGLRTLLFAYRYLDEDDYRKWKAIYHEATTSLVDRQERIETAAELIEQNFDLAGATAIEDKLQQGVPDTIDKLRRANIKVWMLTGDKRETAINIAHSARICKPFSEVYILDSTEGDLQEKIAASLVDVGRGMIPHSVVVIDGQTLSVVEEDESLRILFFDLVSRVDSVICCRASPAQKATLVKCIRDRVRSSLTLAIGDGANDIAMIQASHVGIGISGREGLQAARIADYSIAQFRFLQKLLFVHGRWNYIRTGKYIVGTFWKEIVFYLTQAMYQKYNGYTGTSLYESASLTVFNTLFTSLPVILLGIFEQDLRAETLLAVPELYTFGQKNLGFNFRKYIAWMIMAVLESALIYYTIYGVYEKALFTEDTSLYAMGDLAFTVCVIFINFKMLILEYHNKTIVPAVGFILSVGGWFLWNIFLSAIYKPLTGPYIVRDAFLHNFGRTLSWWLNCLVSLSVVVVFELCVSAIRRIFWPRDQDLMQEIEHYDGVLDVMKEHAAERGEAPGPAAADEEGGAGAVGGGRPEYTDDAASFVTAHSRTPRPSMGLYRGEDGPSADPKRRSARIEEEEITTSAAEGSAAGNERKRRDKQAATTVTEVPTRRWAGDAAARLSAPEGLFVESPIEMQNSTTAMKRRSHQEASSMNMI